MDASSGPVRSVHPVLIRVHLRQLKHALKPLKRERAEGHESLPAGDDR